MKKIAKILNKPKRGTGSRGGNRNCPTNCSCVGGYGCNSPASGHANPANVVIRTLKGANLANKKKFK